jgi:TonB family protein
MTSFQRSLAFSLGIHVLIFGTALAFARYGESLFIGGPRVVTVALVNDNGHVRSGRGLAAHGQSPVRPVDPVTPDENAIKRSTPPSASTDIDGYAREPAGTAVYQGEAGGGASGASDPGQGAGTEGEALSSEQWLQLHSAIEKAKTYPRLARERGIEGKVLVRFKVLPTGDIEAVDVIKSSGAQILDDASVRTVYRAAPMPFVNGWVEVPMVYELK